MMSSEGAASLEKLLNDDWDHHDEDAERLARELEAAAESGVTSDVLPRFLHLAIHTIGEHLGDWTRAFALGRHVLDRHTPTRETAPAWGRLYVAAVLAGDSIAAADAEISYLKAAGDDFGAALLDMRFMLVAALLGAKRDVEAARLYRSALDLVAQIRQSAFLERTIAVASNNLGWELYEKPSRTAHEDALMQLCAETSLTFWLKCGDWINEERALYLKAVVSNVTGRPESGLEDANRALAVINSHGERPLDAALLHLVRAGSLAALGDTDGGLRAVSDADLAASKVAAPGLMARFDAERSKVVAALV